MGVGIIEDRINGVGFAPTIVVVRLGLTPINILNYISQIEQPPSIIVPEGPGAYRMVGATLI